MPTNPSRPANPLQLSANKALFVEPKGKEEFVTTIAQFRQTVDTANGACLFAVCRGKVAEGIDFADKAARAVVILGIPFPSLYDAKVKAKKEYMDSRRAEDQSQLSGQEWYRLEAFRAINQAVGRVIRHKNDFGAVIFLDRRFNEAPVIKDISDWVSSGAVKAPTYAQGLQDVRRFFAVQRTGSALAPRTMNAPKPAAASKPAGGSAFATSGPSSSSSSSSAAPAAKKPRLPAKKIVLKKAAVDNVLKYKATNIVVRLKERLQKEDLMAFKAKIKAYKEEGDLKALTGMCGDFVAAGKLLHEELDELNMFIRDEDAEEYKRFIMNCKSK